MSEDQSSSQDPIITNPQDGTLPSGLGEPLDTTIQIPPHPNTNFSDAEFLTLLSGSISLTRTEKLKIIERIPTLTQHQIDRLLQIFRDEKEKFQEIETSHPTQVSQIELQRQAEWKDIEAQKQEQTERDEETQRLTDLQNKLNL